MSFNEAAYRGALGAFATGVAIVTTCNPCGLPVGLTINSFSSISLKPPLVSWGLRRESTCFDSFAGAYHFAIHILAIDQLDLGRRFARPGANRFANVSYEEGVGRAPLLKGAAAILECESVRQIEIGDHWMHIGEVKQFRTSDLPALAFCRGAYGQVTAFSEETIR